MIQYCPENKIQFPDMAFKVICRLLSIFHYFFPFTALTYVLGHQHHRLNLWPENALQHFVSSFDHSIPSTCILSCLPRPLHIY